MFTLVGVDEAAVELQPRAVGARAIDLRFTGALDLYHQFSDGFRLHSRRGCRETSRQARVLKENRFLSHLAQPAHSAAVARSARATPLRSSRRGLVPAGHHLLPLLLLQPLMRRKLSVAPAQTARDEWRGQCRSSGGSSRIVRSSGLVSGCRYRR